MALPTGGLENAVEAAASALAAAALLCGAGVLLVTRSVRGALPVFLDLLLAAGLLRLVLADSWTAIGTAAAVVALRKLAVAGLMRPTAPATRGHRRAGPPRRRARALSPWGRR